jgi:hypothetical protein
VDTDFMLLEDIMGRVTGQPAGLQIDRTTGHGHGSLGQIIEGPQEVTTDAGFLGVGQRLTDLEPPVLAVEGDQGAIISDSRGLAYLAVDTWGSTIVHDISAIRLMGDTANGSANPLGATGSCPCAGTSHRVIVATGHGAAWSSLTAYDMQAGAAIGVVLDHDVSQSSLDDLLQRIVSLVDAPP